MNRWIAGILVLLTSVSAHAEMGFFHVDTLPANTSPAIVVAAQSVFKIWVPGGALKFKLTNWRPTDVQKMMTKAEASGDYLTSSQLRFCLTTNNDPCVVMDTIATNSGFVMQAGNLLWTTRHAFRDYADQWAMALSDMHPEFTAEAVAAEVVKMQVPILIFDQNGKRVAGGGDKHFSRLAYLPGNPLVNASNFLPAFNSDLAVVEFPVQIGAPLKLAVTKPAVGERMYLLGYPLSTYDRMANFRVPDSTGPHTLHISFGPRIALLEALDRLSKMNSSVREVRDRLFSDATQSANWDGKMTCATIDAEEGSEGGPLINSNGEVVALANGLFKEYRGSEPSLTIPLFISLVP